MCIIPSDRGITRPPSPRPTSLRWASRSTTPPPGKRLTLWLITWMVSRPAPGPVCLGETAKDEEDFHDGGLGLGRNGHRHFLHAASAVVLGSAGCGCGTGGASPDGGRRGVVSEECVGEAG